MRIAEIVECGWRKFVTHASGDCVLKTAAGDVSARWELGELVTGRSGVFHRHMARFALIEATDEFIGIDEQSLRRAVLGAVNAARMAGFEVEVAAESRNFVERGLGWNSGWGEIDGKRVHMMDNPSAYDLHAGTLDSSER